MDLTEKLNSILGVIDRRSSPVTYRPRKGTETAPDHLRDEREEAK